MQPAYNKQMYWYASTHASGGCMYVCMLSWGPVVTRIRSVYWSKYFLFFLALAHLQSYHSLWCLIVPVLVVFG